MARIASDAAIAVSRPSHSPRSSQSPRVQRPRRRGPGVRVRPAALRLERRAARRAPSRPGPSPRATRPSGRGSASTPARPPMTRTRRGRTRRPRPSASSLGSGNIRSRSAGDEVGRVRAAREEDDRAAARLPDLAVAAGLGARVLRVDRPDRHAVAQAVLDHLPVALVAPGPEQAAVLRVGREEHPVLQPRARRAGRRPSAAAGRSGTPGTRPANACDRRQRIRLAARVHDDRRVARQRTGRVRVTGEPQEHGRRQRATGSWPGIMTARASDGGRRPVQAAPTRCPRRTAGRRSGRRSLSGPGRSPARAR